MTTETTPAGTTRARAGTIDRARRRGGLQISVRTRITAVIALLTLAAMTAAGVLVYTLESARIEAAVTEQIDQEIDEFRVFERERRRPRPGRRSPTRSRLLETFLARNVPDDDEMLVGYGGRAPRPNAQPVRRGVPRRPRLPGGGRRAARRRWHRRGPRRALRRGLGHRAARAQPDQRGRPGDRQLPRRRARRARTAPCRPTRSSRCCPSV